MAYVTPISMRSQVLKFGDDQLRVARPVKVFAVAESRYEWSTLASQRGPVLWALSLQQAKKEVEPLRKKGSSWYIREGPACAVVGNKRSLIVASLFQSALRRLTGVSLPAVMRHFSELLISDPYGEMVLLITDTMDFAPATSPWKCYDSEPQGQGWRLSWRPREIVVDLGEVASLVRALDPAPVAP